jgi:hypothetical protein
MRLDEEFEFLKKSDGYDPISMRLIPSKEALERLPIKVVEKQEMWAAKRSAFFNPVNYYPAGMIVHKNEHGHDRNFRYIQKEKNDEVDK